MDRKHSRLVKLVITSTENHINHIFMVRAGGRGGKKGADGGCAMTQRPQSFIM